MRLAAQSRSASEDQSAQDDGGGVAAELQRDVLARHGVHDRVADRAGAGEGDHRQPRVRRPARASPRSATGSTDHIPAGRSVSASSSPSSSADSGVAGAGLRMIGAPTAIAGATLWATRFSGKLNGAMPSTGPRGKRRTIAARPAAGGSVSSRMQLAAVAAGLLGGPAERGRGPGRLAAGPLDRLAVLGGDQAGDLLGPLGEPARTRGQRVGPVGDGQPRRDRGRRRAAAATASSTWAASGTETVADERAVVRVADVEAAARPVAGRPAR